MKLIGCERCPAIFPSEQRYSTVWIFDDLTDHQMQHDAPAPTQIKELCPGCRAELDTFFNHPTIAAPTRPAASRVFEDLPDDQDEAPTHKRQAEKRTCESCGHTGFRKFQKTDTGWCCWRCIDTQKRQLAPPAEDDAGAEPEPEPAPDPDPTPSLPAPAPPPSGVTARCQDCTRTWNLTGFILEKAAEMHELKHGHIVNILEPAGAA